MPMTPIPVLDRTSATFKADVDTFFGARLPAFAAEANALQADVTAKQEAAAIAAAAANAKAGEALTSADSAATAKSGADTARDAAVTAKNAAEAALDSFDDRYLGAKAVAPTLDNDGGALLAGALYWDTALPGMRSWNGTAWVTLPAATAASVGLGSVNNTSDANKPVSTAQQTALNLKAPLASPTLTGTPAAPTAAAGTNTTQLATTAYALAAADLRYGKNNILGTVSQSAGVPTGALIERGSNANGSYVRFADGTQICTHLYTGGVALTAYSGTISGGVYTWTYPADFAVSGAPTVTGAGADQNNGGFVSAGSVTAAQCGVLYFTVSAGVTSSSIRVIAIGRWF